jgi:hypothetical protein
MRTSKTISAKADRVPLRRINDAEPAHSVITKLGGVRALSRALGLSAAAITRWQTRRTPTDKRGCDGVIPEFRRSAVMAVAKTLRKRLTKAEFDRS